MPLLILHSCLFCHNFIVVAAPVTACHSDCCWHHALGLCLVLCAGATWGVAWSHSVWMAARTLYMFVPTVSSSWVVVAACDVAVLLVGGLVPDVLHGAATWAEGMQMMTSSSLKQLHAFWPTATMSVCETPEKPQKWPGRCAIKLWCHTCCHENTCPLSTVFNTKNRKEVVYSW